MVTLSQHGAGFQPPLAKEVEIMLTLSFQSYSSIHPQRLWILPPTMLSSFLASSISLTTVLVQTLTIAHNYLNCELVSIFIPDTLHTATCSPMSSEASSQIKLNMVFPCEMVSTLERKESNLHP